MATGTSLGYRYGDYPCQIGSSAVLRAQFASIDFNYPLIPVFELGTGVQVGLVADPTNATGTLTALVRGSPIASAYGSTAYAWRTATSTFSTAKAKMQNTFLSNVSVTARVGDFATMNVSFMGAIDTGSGVQIPGTPTAPIAFRSPDVTITAPTVTRCQGITVAAALNRVALYELGTGSPLGYSNDPSTARLDVDFTEADATTVPNGTVAAPVDYIVNIGSGNLTVTGDQMVLMAKTFGGAVQGWASRRAVYMSLASSGSGGMALS